MNWSRNDDRRLGAIGEYEARTQCLVRSGGYGEVEDDGSCRRARPDDGVLRFETSSTGSRVVEARSFSESHPLDRFQRHL